MVKGIGSFKAQSFCRAGTMKFEACVVLRLTAGSRMHCRVHLCLLVIGTTPKRLCDFASRCMCVVWCVCVCFFFAVFRWQCQFHKENQTLEIIDLRGNKIGTKGQAALKEAKQVNLLIHSVPKFLFCSPWELVPSSSQGVLALTGALGHDHHHDTVTRTDNHIDHVARASIS